jgi:GTP cyclohydrolase I
MLNEQKLEELFKQLLEEIDSNPKREGLKETPHRMVGYFKELFEGAMYSNEEIAQMFDKQFDIGGDDLVIMNGIHCFSHCEHHCALMELKIHIAYIPIDGKVLGLSKFPRICDMVCKRLQVQERIGMDICEILQRLGMLDVMVVIDGRHACVNARGIKQPETVTRTNCLRGRFKYDTPLKHEVLNSIK